MCPQRHSSFTDQERNVKKSSTKIWGWMPIPYSRTCIQEEHVTMCPVSRLVLGSAGWRGGGSNCSRKQEIRYRKRPLDPNTSAPHYELGDFTQSTECLHASGSSCISHISRPSQRLPCPINFIPSILFTSLTEP